MTEEFIFSQAAVVNLHDIDFQLDTENKINLKNKTQMNVLFYTTDVESLNVAKMWLLAAQQTGGGTKFGACNLNEESDVDTAFKDLNSAGNHPFHWAALSGYPFILTYREGMPVGFYNGERSVGAFVNYALILAFKNDYFEKKNLRRGSQVDEDYAMTGYVGYTKDHSESSEQFKSDVSPTGYNPEEPV